MIGYRYFRGASGEWRRHHGALIPLSMPHVISVWIPRPHRILVINARAWFARWEESFDQTESVDWWYVIKDEREDLNEYSRSTRSKVRRGAKRLEALPVSRQDILNRGYPVYRSAFSRYDTFEKILSERKFEDSVRNLPSETEFWAVYERDTRKMVAFSENIVRDGACFYNTIWFDPQALKNYASYLLIHEMNNYYLNDRELSYVSDGARNISHQTGIHDFLEHKFSFRRAYADLKIMYFPGVGIIVRLLFPFRKWFVGRSSTIVHTLSVLLEQERIRQACQKVENKKI